MFHEFKGFKTIIFKASFQNCSGNKIVKVWVQHFAKDNYQEPDIALVSKLYFPINLLHNLLKYLQDLKPRVSFLMLAIIIACTEHVQ